MKTFVPLLIISVLFVSITSCTKSEFSQNPTDTTSIRKANLLSKFVFLHADSWTLAPHDTSLIVYYKYDDKSRLVQASVLYYNGKLAPDTIPFHGRLSDKSVLYYKNSSDTLPYKFMNYTVWSNGGFFQRTSDTTHRSYDPYGRIARDSIHYFTNLGNFFIQYNVVVHEYKYKDSFTFRKFYNLTANTIPTYDTFTNRYNNGNLIYQRSNIAWQKYFSFSLDNHPNPLYKNGFGINPKICQNYDDIIEGFLGYKNEIQKNNYISAMQKNESVNGTHFKEIKSQYTYRSDGFPLKVSSTLIRGSIYPNGTIGSDAPLFFTGIYIYN